jgi:hypothetical protein
MKGLGILNPELHFADEKKRQESSALRSSYKKGFECAFKNIFK